MHLPDSYKDPEDLLAELNKFMRKGEYRRAYQRLASLIKIFPDDVELRNQMIELCFNFLHEPRLARPWLMKRIGAAGHWRDYALLGVSEVNAGSIEKARQHLNMATRLLAEQATSTTETRKGKEFLGRVWRSLEALETPHFVPGERRRGKLHLHTPEKRPARPTAPRKAAVEKEQPPAAVPASKETRVSPTYAVPVNMALFDIESAAALLQTPSSLRDCQLRIQYARLNLQREFGELLCLATMTGVERYWYQMETVKKALKYFHGRVLLCDEVGLGKTIEAGMLIKEYLLRGMVKRVLVLTPAPLVSQWREEMAQKFGIEFATTEDAALQNDPDAFWQQPLIIASLHTAKGSRSFDRVVRQAYDLVVVDECHHLRNRQTLAWKLVNQLQERFIFLLTATPVQNDLIELFNLITLLKPGQFKTEKLFKKEYMLRGDRQAPANKEKLRELLRDVMIRNTRSAIDLKLPKRFAATLRLEPSEVERRVYEGISELARNPDHSLSRPMLHLLMREAGSSPFALKQTLLRMRSGLGTATDTVLEAIEGLSGICKGKALVEILQKNPNEKKVVFTQYLKSMDYVTTLLDEHSVLFARFRGDMTPEEKNQAIRQFQDQVPVLVSAESGGEGRNLQFCNTLINFDLPWNPMRIEQRVGRLHRIGQTRDVFVFNLSVRGTIEDQILEILDNKINMFEMVIGEIEPILGYLGEDEEFDEIVMAIWLKSSGLEQARQGFEELGEQLVKAKADYLKTKELDKDLFGEDYEV